jgi:hypothetical protein
MSIDYLKTSKAIGMPTNNKKHKPLQTIDLWTSGGE